jgi:catechol 2,3-dioxygenase
MSNDTYIIPATANIGHIHLNVADLDRSLAFYCGTLGFGLVTRYAEGPHGAAFVSAGGYHHHIGLNTWRSRGATPAPSGHTGLFHLAVRYANRRDLARAVRRVLEAGIVLGGATDHGVSHSVYLSDPDGNGVELTCDLPESEWPRNERGEPDMFSGKALDLNNLMAE